MTKFSITMSDDLGSYDQGAMKDRKFDNISEYFRHLVRQDWEKQQAEKELRSLIDEGLQSGISDDSVDTIWASAIEEANN